MHKSLHSLTTSVARAIVLFALFVVGLTASAGHYHVDFREAGATTFIDGVKVVSKVAATEQGLPISSMAMLQLRFEAARTDGEGIGRIVFTLAPETQSADVSALLASTITGAGYFSTQDGDKLVYTPRTLATTCDIAMNDPEGLFRPLVIQSAEVFTGFGADPQTGKNINTGALVTNSLTLTYNVSIASKPAQGWKAVNSGDILPIDHFVGNSPAKSCLRLVRGNYSLTADGLQADCSAMDTDCTFDVIAPTGFAISALRIIGSQLEGVSVEGGDLIGNMDLIWTNTEEKPFSTSAHIHCANKTTPALIKSIRVTYVALSPNVDVAFAVDQPTQIWPAAGQVDASMIFGGVLPISVTAMADRPYTATKPSLQIDALIDGNYCRLDVESTLMNEPEYSAVVFNVTLPANFDTRVPHTLLFLFPEGCIFSADGHNSAFNAQFSFDVPELYTLKAWGSNPAAADLSMGHTYHGTPVRSETLNYFNTYFVNATGDGPAQGLAWVDGRQPDKSLFTVRNENTGENIPIVDLVLHEQSGQGSVLSIAPQGGFVADSTPYSITIPKGVLVSPDGRRNPEQRLGFYLLQYVDRDAAVKFQFSPVPHTRIRELGKVRITPTIDGDVEILEEYMPVYYNGGANFVSAAVSLDGRTVVIDFNRAITAGDVDSDGTTESAVDFPEGIFSVGGKVYPALQLNYIFDESLETVRYGHVEPVEEQPYSIDDLMVNCKSVDNVHGFFVAFPQPVCGADGPLQHGSRLFGSLPAGFSFFRTTAEGSTDCSTSAAAMACAYNNGGEYGIFFRLATSASAVQPGQYRLVLPEGCLFFEGGKINADADITWELIDAEPAGSFAVVSPTADVPCRSLREFYVASQVVTHRVDITAVNDRVQLDVFDTNAGSGYTAWASVSLIDGGNGEHQAVFSLDEPINADTPDVIKIMIRPGAFTTDSGRTNPAIEATFTVNSSIALLDAIGTTPTEYRPGASFPASVQEFLEATYANGQKGFLVRYDRSLAAASNERLWSTKPAGFRFTFTPAGSSDFRDMTWAWEDAVAYDDNTHIHALDIPMDAAASGDYHLVVPEGAFAFADGSLNAAIDVTWRLVDTFAADAFYFADPIGGVDAFPYIDHLEVAPTRAARDYWGSDISISSVPSDPVKVNYNYTDIAGNACSYSINANVSITRGGNVRFDFERPLAEAYPVYYIFGIEPGSFTCNNGYTNPALWTPASAPYHVEKPDYFTYYFQLNGEMPADGYTVTIDGETYAPDAASGYVIVPGLTHILKAEDISISGFDNYSIEFGDPDFDRSATSLAYVPVTINVYTQPQLYSLSVDEILIEFPVGTVSRDKLRANSTQFSFIFDRLIDEGSFNQDTFAAHVSVVDAGGNHYGVGWSSSSGSWLGFGLDNWYAPLPVGTYSLRIGAGAFKFTDGQTNGDIDFTVTVTGGPAFEYTGYAAATLTNEGGFTTDDRVWEVSDVLYDFALAYDPERFSFEANDSRPVVATVYTDGLEPRILTGAATPMSDAQGKAWLLFTFVDFTDGTHVAIAESGNATVHFDAGAFSDDNGAENEEINLWFSVADYYAVDVYVDGQRTDLCLVRYYKDDEKELPIDQKTLYDIHSGDHISKAGLAGFIVAPPTGFGDLFQYESSSTDGVHRSFYYSFKGNAEYYLADYDVDGGAGLRSATLTFGQQLDARYFRQRIEWSEGFRLLKRDDATAEVDLMPAIDYVTTTVSGQQLVLNFFDAQDREIYPLDNGAYYLQVPTVPLFAFTNAFEGSANEIKGFGYTSTGIELYFNVTTPDIVTDDAAHDAEANKTFGGKVSSLADIILKKRSTGARTNDINGDGSISIGDLVRLIRQAQQ